MITKDTRTADWRSYKNLLGLQTQNAFNDKMAQFLIIPLAFWLTEAGQGQYESMPHILAVLIAVPYLMLAPIAGWLSDRFAKSTIIRWSAFFQTIVLGAMFASVMLESVWGVVACFFTLAIQSTILNPAKRGIIKELVGERNLGSASGFLEMAVVLAVCAGQIIAGFWFAHEVSKGNDGWDAMKLPLQFLLVATLLPIILAFFVKKTEAERAEPWRWQMGFSHFSQLKRIWQDRPLRLCALGKAFFWGYAGVLNLWQISMAKELVKESGVGYGTLLSYIMLAASGGVVLGGITASLLSRKRIELGLLPIGGLFMLVGVILLAFASNGGAMMYVSFLVAGFGGAMFLVPLNGQLQNLAPGQERGRILAGSSVLDCLFGISAVAFQFILTALNVPIWIQCVILSVVIVGVLVYLMQIIPKTFVRFIMRKVFGVFFKMKVAGMDNIPSEGGVLLTPNHISYVDSIILSMACPRPVRFLMIRDCFKTPGVGLFANYFDTIPISKERAKEAIRLAADALKEGTVVCIFPEGQLTRTGALSEIKRGYEMIARQAKSLVIPVYMDGLWGSLSSFEREKMYFKIPRRYPKGIRVHFGEALKTKEELARKRMAQELHALSYDAIQGRHEMTHEKWIQKRLQRVNLSKKLRGEIDALSWEQLKLYVFNAMQLRELSLFRDRKKFGIEEGTGAEIVVSVLAAICKGSVHFHGESDTLDTKSIMACDYFFLGERLRSSTSKIRNCLLIDVNGAPIPSNTLQPLTYPAGLVNGLFTTFSMPHPRKIKLHDPLQPGWKHNSTGRILPGTRKMPEECDEEFFIIND